MQTSEAMREVILVHGNEKADFYEACELVR